MPAYKDPGAELMRWLNLLTTNLTVCRTEARVPKRKMRLDTIPIGKTIAPGVSDEYEIVLNNTVFIGYENGQHFVYTLIEIPATREEPSDADVKEWGRFERAVDAARCAVLTWATVLIDSEIEAEGERLLAAELDAIESRGY